MYVEKSKMQCKILFSNRIAMNLCSSMRWIIIAMRIMIQVLNKSTSLEILLNELRNLNLPYQLKEEKSIFMILYQIKKRIWDLI